MRSLVSRRAAPADSQHSTQNHRDTETSYRKLSCRVGGGGGAAHTSPRLGLGYCPGTEHASQLFTKLESDGLVCVTLEKSEVAASHTHNPSLPPLAPGCGKAVPAPSVCKPIQYQSCTFGCMHLQFS